MVRYVRTGPRTDVFFDVSETAFDIGAMILAICAYPDDTHQKPKGPANKFWDAVYYCIARNGSLLQATAGLPERKPSDRSADTQLGKGFDRIDLYRSLATHLVFSFAAGGALSLTPARDLRSLKIEMRFDDQGRVLDAQHQKPSSIRRFLKTHQPAFGRGVDELNSCENETVKTLEKRHLRPMFRVIHILHALSHEITVAGAKEEPWEMGFLYGDPGWALRVVESSRRHAAHEAQLLRQFGVKSASIDGMVHLHLPKHVQILPPTPESDRRHNKLTQ